MKKLLCLIFVCILLCAPLTVHADYTLEDNERVFTPRAYTYESTLDGFQGISDIFIDDHDNLYVCDDTANQIIKFNAAGERVLTVSEGLNKPQGIFIDDTEDIFVADTGNHRVAHFDKNGKFVEEFKDIKSELLGEDFVFDPQKIAVTSTGYILAIKGQSIMQIDAYSNFRGYIGQPEVGFNLTDMLLRMFASEKQKRYVSKRIAPPYTNLCIGEDNAIYAVSRDNTYGEIKKLNSVGTNTYRQNPSSFEQALSFVSSFISVQIPTQYLGERVNDAGIATMPVFEDVAVDAQGIITVLDTNVGKLYQYDQEGNNLCCFGGKGEQNGYFDSPVAMDIDSQGRIFVADKNLKNIQLFQKTSYIQNVHDAVYAYSSGRYQQAYDSWQSVLDKNENYRLAHKGLGLSLYKLGDYQKAMDEFMIAEDRENYSKAFDKQRYEIFKNYFLIVAPCILIGAAAIFVYIFLLKKVGNRSLALFTYRSREPAKRRSLLLLSVSTVFHPVDTFDNIKLNRGKNRLYIGAVLILLAFVVRLFYMFTVHFPVADVDLNDAMLSLEVIKMVLPVVTWAVAAYAISSIMNGESKFSEVFTCSAYSLVPYIVFTPVLALVSRVLSLSEWPFYSIVVVGLMVWQAVLLIISVSTLNQYSAGKTVLVCFLSFLTMLLIWAVALLCMALIGQLVQFIAGVFNEIRIVV